MNTIILATAKATAGYTLIFWLILLTLIIYFVAIRPQKPKRLLWIIGIFLVVEALVFFISNIYMGIEPTKLSECVEYEMNSEYMDVLSNYFVTETPVMCNDSTIEVEQIIVDGVGYDDTGMLYIDITLMGTIHKTDSDAYITVSWKDGNGNVLESHKCSNKGISNYLGQITLYPPADAKYLIIL